MKITLEIPDSRADFLLELLRSRPFVKLRGQAAKAVALDETAHLLASPTNAKRLYAALDRDRRGQQPVGLLRVAPRVSHATRFDLPAVPFCEEFPTQSSWRSPQIRLRC